ncbi:MAG: hypothetical protein RLZZ444_2240 [Pseudomonadota bacterium]
MAHMATLPSLEALKEQAKRLRETLARQGSEINHSKALELLAGQFGFRDWNTLHAAVGNRPPKPTLALGAKVSGHYLGQAFTGEIIAIQALTSVHGKYRVTFDFDEPVDVVTFESFSAYRKRVTVTLDEDGRTVEKTSNGRPHMVLA